MEIIVAYKQNGQYLHPDHGFPARCIIPGWIAGRMVKWLAEIKVTDRESDNYYYYYDNKVRSNAMQTPRSCCAGCAVVDPLAPLCATPENSPWMGVHDQDLEW